MLRKIITYFLIIAVVLPVFASAVPSASGVKIAKAEVTDETSNNTAIKDPCVGGASVIGTALAVLPSLLSPFPSWDCIFFTFTKALYIMVMWPAIWLAGFASEFFNVSIQFSLTGETFDAEKNIMIKEGWILIRDLFNLVFIFILLAAAISTILQHGGLEIKKVLPSLIVVALLVNFSLMIAKMVIDASHIFAWEFYNQIDVTDGGTYQFANSTGSVESNRLFTKKNLAGVFLAGFNPQQILLGKATIQDGKPVLMSPFNEMVIKAREGVKEGGGGKTFLDIMPGVIIIILSEAVLAIYAALILLVGAIMFILRVVVLWLVMIFSPIAFFGMILPSMQKYSGMWWKYLIDQSFFAPAFLFMFMLATKFINSKLIDSLFTVEKNSDSMIVAGLNMGQILIVFFNFLVVGLLLAACLIVAKQLGGKTAEFGIGGAHKIKGLALGGVKYGWAGTKAGTRRFYAPVAEDFAVGKGKAGKVGDFIRRIPILGSLATRKAAGTAIKSRAIIEEKQKKYEKYSPEEMAKIVEAGGRFDKFFSPYETTARARVLDDKKSLKDADPEIILQAIKTLESIGNIKGANDLKKMRPDLAGGVVITAQTARPLTQTIADAIKKAVGFQKPEDITELKFETNFFDKTNNQFNNPAAEQVVKGVLENYKSGQIRKLYERGDDFYNEVVQEIHNLAPLTQQQIQAGQTKIKAVDVANAMRQHPLFLKNKGLATALESGNLNDLLGLG